MGGSSGAIKAGRAFVEIYADDSKLAQSLRASEGKLKKWGASVRALGASILSGGLAAKGALAAATGVFEEAGTAIAEMSARTGMTAEQLSQLGYAAGQSCVSMEDLETGIRKMQKQLGEASIGSAESAEHFRELGLDARKLLSMSPEKQFEAIAQAVSGIQNPAQRAAASMAVFGKNGTALLPMLSGSAAGIQQLMAKADQLGLTMSTDDANAAHELHQAMTTVWATLKGAAIAIGAALAPAMTEIANRASTVIGAIVNWIKQNRGLIVTVSTVATGVVAVGAAIVGIGYLISGVGAVFGMLATAITTFGAVTSGVFAAAAGAIGFILSPIGLVAAAVIGLGAYFLSTSGVIERATAFLSDSFGTLASDFKVAFDAMKAALGAGDFGAAAKVLWSLLKLEWVRGLNYVNGIWLSAKTFFLETWTAAGFEIADVLESAFALVEDAWNATVDALHDGWQWLTSSLYGLWQKFISFVAGAGESILGALKPVLEAVGADVSGVNNSLAKTRQGADQAAADNNAEYDRQKGQRAADRSSRDAANQQQRGARHNAAQQALDESLAAYEKARQDAATKGESDAQAELDKARADLANAATAAHAAGKKSSFKGTPAGGDVEERSDAASSVEGKLSSRGVLSSFAVMAGALNDSPIAGVVEQSKKTNSLLSDSKGYLVTIAQNTGNGQQFWTD
jgi:hypothetical protein